MANLWNDLSVGSLPEDAEFTVIIVAFSFPMPCSQEITWHCSKSRQMAFISNKKPFFPAYILIFYFYFLQIQDI